MVLPTDFRMLLKTDFFLIFDFMIPDKDIPILDSNMPTKVKYVVLASFDFHNFNPTFNNINYVKRPGTSMQYRVRIQQILFTFISHNEIMAQLYNVMGGRALTSCLSITSSLGKIIPSPC